MKAGSCWAMDEEIHLLMVTTKHGSPWLEMVIQNLVWLLLLSEHSQMSLSALSCSGEHISSSYLLESSRMLEQ
jgi:hypothetical protein